MEGMTMIRTTRRDALKLFGASLTVAGSIGTVYAKHESGATTIQKLGHSLLDDPEGAFAEAAVRNDGEFAVVGSFLGTGGSILVDVSDPTNPTKEHRVSSSENFRNADVAFDSRDGLYYRTLEPNFSGGQGKGEGGVEIIDYGFGTGSPARPTKLTRIPTIDETHNLEPHPNPGTNILYTVNEELETAGMEVWDVETPSNPEKIREAGPTGGLHDIVVDSDRNQMHAAYISDAFGAFDPAEHFAGYAIFDVSDPEDPSTIGRFDYAQAPDYDGDDDGTEEQEDVGTVGFERCHYATFDPERDVAVVGDEKATDVPGGKHVFDVSNPANPTPVGFTLSPHAEFMGDDDHEAFDWTGHNFDVLPPSESPSGNTLLVSGDYHEGMVVYDIEDTSDPTALDQYRTDDGAPVDNPPILALGEAPMAWDADYNSPNDMIVTSDMFTGIYTFGLTSGS